MWAFILIFNLFFLSVAKAQIASGDLCADEWVLMEKEPAEIGGLSGMSCNKNLSLLSLKAAQYPHHFNTLEGVLCLKPKIFISEHPVGFFKERKLGNQGVTLITLPPLKTWDDLFIRFPKTSYFQLPPLGNHQKILILSYQFHSPGKGTFWDDVVTKMGFQNVTRQLNIKGWGYISPEHILTLKPNLILLFGDEVKLPKYLNHIPQTTIPSNLYLCPSPPHMQLLIRKLT